MNEATATLTGNVATSVRFARTDKGTAIASFRLACTPRHFDRTVGAWVDERTSFLSVMCFRSLAENVATSLVKGDPVMITGRLRVVPWERNDKSGISVEVDAVAVGHDLNRGQTRFARVRREITSDEGRLASDQEVAGESTGEDDSPAPADTPDQPSDVPAAAAA